MPPLVPYGGTSQDFKGLVNESNIKRLLAAALWSKSSSSMVVTTTLFPDETSDPAPPDPFEFLAPLRLVLDEWIRMATMMRMTMMTMPETTPRMMSMVGLSSIWWPIESVPDSMGGINFSGSFRVYTLTWCGAPAPLTLWPTNSPTYFEPGSNPETVKLGIVELILAAKIGSNSWPLAPLVILYTARVKCWGKPPLKPGAQVTWKLSVDSLTTEQFWTASGLPEMDR